MTVAKYSRVTKDEAYYNGVTRAEYRVSEDNWILGYSEQSQWSGGSHIYDGHVEVFIHKNVVYMALV